MDASRTRTARRWLNACIVGMIVWGSSLIVSDHLPSQSTGSTRVVQVAVGGAGALLWTGAGWRTIMVLRQSGIPLVPGRKAAVVGLVSVAVLQEIWIVLLLLVPHLVTARVLAETNLLAGCTITLAGMVYWNTPIRT